MQKRNPRNRIFSVLGVKAVNKHDFPKWIFKTSKQGFPFAFRNLRCVDGFHAAVRVGFDGVCIFGKNGQMPNLFYMNPIEFATLEDFKERKGRGFKAYEVGCIKGDGSPWFAYCLEEPGLIEEDYEELKSLLLAFSQFVPKQNKNANAPKMEPLARG